MEKIGKTTNYYDPNKSHQTQEMRIISGQKDIATVKIITDTSTSVHKWMVLEDRKLMSDKEDK